MYPKKASSTHSILALVLGPISAVSRMLVYVSVKMSHAPSIMDSVPSLCDFITRPTLHRGRFCDN